MITKRLFGVELVLAAGLSAIFFLPDAPKASPAGIATKLPIWVGPWLGEDAEVSKKELDVLAEDTQFARKTYTSPTGDQIYVSIVLSGQDMSGSIHRPERCLPAQGWSLRNSSSKTIPLGTSGSLATTRLSNGRIVTTNDNRRITIQNLTYYWFVGYNEVTSSHLARTMFDVRDRIFRGYDQRWAYVTVAATVTKGIARPNRSEAETAAMIEQFIKELAPRLQRPDGNALLATVTK
jgi:EpsI family protein